MCSCGKHSIPPFPPSAAVLDQSDKFIATAVADLMTPTFITETVGATFEAMGYPMMSRAARLCVSTCKSYAKAVAAARLPLGAAAIMNNTTRPEVERAEAVRGLIKSSSEGNVAVSGGAE